MSNIDLLLESDLNAVIFENDDDVRGEILLESGEQASQIFESNLINYVMENYDTFIGKDYKETHKNILTFSQAAKNQFLSEVSALISNEIIGYLPHENKVEASTEDYI
jgi:hypothetical protein